MRRRWLFALVLLLCALVTFPFLWREWVEWRYGRQIVTGAELGDKRVALVFGAAVYRNGRLSPMLRDRVETAVRLYEAGKVDRILMSGGPQHPERNEPDAMIDYARERGVPAAALQADYGGWRTYDSCYRARHVFGLKDVVLVTQQFHLPRALFTCAQLGIDAAGVAADLRTYHPASLGWSRSRELAALLRALVDTVVQAEPAVVET